MMLDLTCRRPWTSVYPNYNTLTNQMTHRPVPGQIQLRPHVRKEKGWHLSSGKRPSHFWKTPYFTPIILVIFPILLLDRKLMCESDSRFSVLRPLNISLCCWTLSFGFDFWLGDNEWGKNPSKARGSGWFKLVTTLSISRQSKVIAPNVMLGLSYGLIFMLSSSATETTI